MSTNQPLTEQEYDDLFRRGSDVAALDAEARARYLQELVAATLSEGPLWTLQSELVGGEWEARRAQDWFHVRSSDAPGLEVFVRLQITEQGLAVTGLLLEREGRAVQARDLRRINLRPLTDRLLAGYRPLVAMSGEQAIKPGRPGRRGYDVEHWRNVAALYDEALARHPRDYVKRMRETWPERERPSDATVRRWVQTVLSKRAQGEL